MMEIPMGDILRGTYCGDDFPDLKGKTALLMAMVDSETMWLAQFDDPSVLYLSSGWHSFARASFRVDEVEGGAT